MASTHTIEGRRDAADRPIDTEGGNVAKTYTVERSVRIDAPSPAVYERIADFRRWRSWSPYEDLDPEMDRKYAGPVAGVGANYEWSGNMKAGAGRMEIVEAVPGERVVIEQQNHKPFKSETTTTFTLDGSGDATSVTWSITGPKTRMIRIMGVVRPMDQVVGPLFEAGLKRLKADVEAA